MKPAPKPSSRPMPPTSPQGSEVLLASDGAEIGVVVVGAESAIALAGVGVAITGSAHVGSGATGSVVAWGSGVASVAGLCGDAGSGNQQLLPNRQHVDVGQSVQLHQLLRGDVVQKRDGVEGVIRLHDVNDRAIGVWG